MDVLVFDDDYIALHKTNRRHCSTVGGINSRWINLKKYSSDLFIKAKTLQKDLRIFLEAGVSRSELFSADYIVLLALCGKACMAGNATPSTHLVLDPQP